MRRRRESFAYLLAGGWVTTQVDLFGGGAAPYSEPWPPSGVLEGGACYSLAPRVVGVEPLDIRYPTPSRTYYGSNKAGSVAHPRPGEKERLSLQAMARRGVWPEGAGNLNPEWAEALMGYPCGWTDLTNEKE